MPEELRGARMILYHGSNTEIEQIDLGRCKPFKDFGRGFYLTTLDRQAFDMADRTTALQGCGRPIVTAYEFPDDWRSEGLSVREFDGPSREWAMFVMNNRSRSFTDLASPECNHDCKYDIVYGPVADDRIAASFQLYQDKMITADELAARLEYRELNDQYSFHTERAVALLDRTGFLYERR